MGKMASLVARPSFYYIFTRFVLLVLFSSFYCIQVRFVPWKITQLVNCTNNMSALFLFSLSTSGCRKFAESPPWIQFTFGLAIITQESLKSGQIKIIKKKGARAAKTHGTWPSEVVKSNKTEFGLSWLPCVF